MVYSTLHFLAIAGITIRCAVVFGHAMQGRPNELCFYCKNISEIICNKNCINYNREPYYKIYKCKVNLLYSHASEDGPKRPIVLQLLHWTTYYSNNEHK